MEKAVTMVMMLIILLSTAFTYSVSFPNQMQDGPGFLQAASSMEPPSSVETVSSKEPPPSVETASSMEPSPSVESASYMEPPPSVETVSSMEPPPSVETGSSVEPPPSVETASSMEPPSSVETGSSVEPPPSVETASSMAPPPSVESRSSVEPLQSMEPASSGTAELLHRTDWPLKATISTEVPSSGDSEPPTPQVSRICEITVTGLECEEIIKTKGAKNQGVEVDYVYVSIDDPLIESLVQ